MLKAFREQFKRMPIVGPYLHDLYLRSFKNEGEILTIRSGALAGGKWVRFMRTHNDEYGAGTYEIAVQKVIAQYLKPGMVFYDVGANVGYFSIVASRLVGPTGAVVAFEPHPMTAKHLRAQFTVNDAKNVRVIQSAVCDRVGLSEFSDDTISVMASLTANTSAKTITVPTTTLDYEAGILPTPSLIKIDVEGSEIDVLRGARNVILKHKPTLLVELHSPEIASRYENFMKELGYSTYHLDGTIFRAGGSERTFVLSLAGSMLGFLRSFQLAPTA